MRIKMTLAAAGAVALLAGCGSASSRPQAVATPKFSPTTQTFGSSPTPAAPTTFALWTPVCQRLVNDMANVGYNYQGNGIWSMPPPGTTYGQLQGLAHQLAHLSYVEMYGGAGNGDAQIANVLGDAGVKFFTFMPAAAYSNSVYHRLLHKAAPHAVLHGWYHKYLDPALVDCKNEAA